MRTILITLFTLTISLSGECFAASGSANTGTTQTSIAKDSEQTNDTKSEISIEEKKTEERQTEKNAQKIILEVYKIQGNKILKEMDTNIEKINPDPKVRIEVYTGIQKTLEFRKQKLGKGEMSTESKDILVGYIDYMISSIEKRKKALGSSL